MELLQNCGYKLGEMNVRYFHEIRMRVESIIELCQEGEISVYEAYPIISLEFIYSEQYNDDLWEKLEDLEGDIIGLDELEKHTRDAERHHYQIEFDNMQNYYIFTRDATRKTLWEILKNKDYQQKRKAKIKSQIIRDGLILSQEKIGEEQKTNEGHTALPKSDTNNQLPPVIQAVLTEGLLNKAPVNGKYTKRAGIKDMGLIKWIFDISGYGDSLTADLYMQYIHVDIAPQTIGQYISRAKKEAE